MGNQVKRRARKPGTYRWNPRVSWPLLPAPRALIQAAGPEESRRCGRFSERGDARSEQAAFGLLLHTRFALHFDHGRAGSSAS
jgi:hypothetical protein